MARRPNKVYHPVEDFNPLNIKDSDIDVLELDDDVQISYNPLLDIDLNTSKEPILDIINLSMNQQYLDFACRNILNIKLLPYQLIILETFFTHNMCMLIATRGGSKSTLLGVYCLLRMMFHPGCKIAVVGAAFRQSKIIFDGMQERWENAPILREIAGKGKQGPRRDIDRCEFIIGQSKCYILPLGDGSKIRGLRANYIIIDEAASVPESILNIVVKGFGLVSSDPAEKSREYATIKKLKAKGLWSEEAEEIYRNKAGGNQIIHSGTAYYEFNHFYKTFKTYHDIITSRGHPEKLKELFQGETGRASEINWKDYAILRIPYTALPEMFLDPGILSQARATMTTSQFHMELNAVFSMDSNGFFKRSVIEGATTTSPIKTADGYIQFSAMLNGDPNKVYVIGIDPAADQDNAAIVVLEIGVGHRKVVYSWTTNRKRYVKHKEQMRARGEEIGDDYYRYIAKKIRSLMRLFNTEAIIMDKNGGGVAIQEALSSFDTCESQEYPIYLVPDPDEPKADDARHGLHILHLVTPTLDYNGEANHGLLKDLQDKFLLFPTFDTVEIARAIEMDKMNRTNAGDNLEKLVLEVEEIKNELTTIVCTPSSNLGRETFNTPEIKQEGSRKGRLRKDRYSALLYANYYARSKNKNEPFRIDYKPVGRLVKEENQVTINPNESLYYGPGTLKWKDSGQFTGGRLVRKNIN